MKTLETRNGNYDGPQVSYRKSLLAGLTCGGAAVENSVLTNERPVAVWFRTRMPEVFKSGKIDGSDRGEHVSFIYPSPACLVFKILDSGSIPSGRFMARTWTRSVA